MFSFSRTSRKNVKIFFKCWLFVFGVVVIFLYSCDKNHESTPVDCSGPAKSFATDVSPVIQASCATNAACHGAGSINGPGALLVYSQVFNARSDIHSAVSSGHMPPNGALAPSDKNSILCWINNGAANN